MFNLLQVVNAGEAPRADPRACSVVRMLPKAAVGAGIMEGSTPNAIAAGSKVTVTGPFPPGTTTVQFAYSIPLGSDTITLDQKMPAQLPQVAIIVQKAPGMELSSPQVKEHADRTAEGQNYIVGQGGAVRAGETLSLTLSGLPHRSTWPRNIALTLAAVILGAGVWGAARLRPAPGEKDHRRQMQAQRDSLFAQLTALETQRRQGKIDQSAYAARRETLVGALEDLYAGLDQEAVA